MTSHDAREPSGQPDLGRSKLGPATYTVGGLICDNCGHKPRWPGAELEIPQGQAVKNTPCPKCGCKTLRRGF